MGGPDAGASEQLALRTTPDGATLPWLQLPGFGARHGFTTRYGGVSRPPFHELNLGLSVGDDADAVTENRRRALTSFGADPDRTALLHQEHGTTVHRAEEVTGFGELRGDALISKDPAWTLAISAADCVPVLLHDPVRGAAGAAHAGWRGAAGGVIAAVVRALREAYGTDPADLRVAIGPCISAAAYQVGPEVVRAFRDAGMPEALATP
ncbi:MAG: polyphenol oxidase family protein, partial [Trueperaceae bacterium]